MGFEHAIARPAVSVAATALTALVAAAAVAPVPAAAAPVPGSNEAGYAVGGSADDVPHVIAGPSEVLVPEGRSGSFTVRLSHPPSGTVYVGMRFNGTGIWAGPPMLLSFSPSDWNIPKGYGIASMSDPDAVDDVVVVTLSVPGYLSDTVTLRQIDDD